MAKIVIPAEAGTHHRELQRAIKVLNDVNVNAEGRILLVYPMLRVAECDAPSALCALQSAGIGARRRS